MRVPILPMWLADFYKIGHPDQWPEDVEQVWVNWTPRGPSRVPGVHRVHHVGQQYFIKEYLGNVFDRFFFQVPIEFIIDEYREVIRNTLGVDFPKIDHIEWLHAYGKLPLKIYSVPEGDAVPFGVPASVITNTHPKAHWLPNFIETMYSNVMWMPSTSATTAKKYRKIFEKWARAAGEDDLSFVNWQGHDFSYRGMAGTESAALSGLGHLTCFSGTDTIPALMLADEYYDSGLAGVGGSVPATEHSVMCAGTKGAELDTFRRLITKVYPRGIVSIVSDTWDLWKVLEEYVPALKNEILARDGKIVIRPDSGDPVEILCGLKKGQVLNPAERDGVLALLALHMGTEAREGKLPMIRKAGAIYGDSITPERAEAILQRTVEELKLSPYNVVLGIGSYTYQYVTRDTYNFAMKATAVKRDGKVIAIHKDPVTDTGHKRSHVGIPAVYQADQNAPTAWPPYFVVQTTDPDDLDRCAFQKVYEDGDLLVHTTLAEVRGRVRASV